MLYRFTNIVVMGVFLVLAPHGFAGEIEEESSSGLTISAVWGLLGYPRTAELNQQEKLATSETNEEEVVQNPLYIPDIAAPTPNDTNNAQPAPVVQPSPSAESVAPPVQATEQASPSSSALKNPNDEDATPGVEVQNTIKQEVLFENVDLLASRVVQFSNGNQKAYQKAKDAYSANPKNPLVYYITTHNPEDFWLGLINFGIDNHDVTSLDLMWIIHEYARPYYVKQQQAEALFKDVIVAHLASAKVGIITDLLTSLSIQPTNSWSYTYDKNDRFSILANTLELGYSNAKYTQALKDIMDRLPAEKVDAYESVKLHVKNEIVSYNLVAWLLKDKAHYVVKKYDYAVRAAQHLFARRLAAQNSDKPDLQGDIVALATVLLRERLINEDAYAKASTRFIK